MRVLIADMYHSSSENEEKVFKEYGISVDIAHCKTQEELIDTAKGYSALLVSYVPITEKVLEALPEVKAVVKYGVGVDNINLEAARKKGVAVFNVTNHCTEEVALQALALTLDAARRTSSMHQSILKGEWVDPKMMNLKRMSSYNLGLIGFGRISRKYLEFIKPIIKGEVFVFDPYADKSYPEVTFVDTAEQVFAKSDIVSLFTPLTEETRGIVNKETLKNAKNVIFINTSRGGTVNYEDLCEALEDGRIFYVASDVWKNEPVVFDELTNRMLATGRLTLTPHAGWYSFESEKELRSRAAEEIALFLTKGESINRLV